MDTFRGLMLVMLFLPGCMAIGTRVDEGQLLQFERGKTTYFEVVAQLGRPNTSTLAADGSRQIAYVYTQQQLKVQNFIPIVAAFTQGATAETSIVTLDFDPQARLIQFTAVQGSTQVGTGFTSGAKQ
jgi:hypothetical protein